MSKHNLGNLVLNFFTVFLADMKGVSKNTMASYSDAITILFNFTAKKLGKTVVEIELEDIDETMILSFLDHLENERGNKICTRNQRLAVIKTFFGFLASKIPEMLDVCRKICSICMKKTKSEIIESLTEAEVKAFFTAIEEKVEQNTTRDRALFRLLYNTGARVSEIINVKLEDIDLENSFLVKLHGKGNKERVICLYPETIEAIKLYILWKNNHGCKDEYIFLNKYGEKMTRQGVNYLVNKYVKRATVSTPSLASKKIFPHTFRHTTALHLLKSGNDIFFVKDWLGHEDINTTSAYVKINIQMKRDVIDKINIFKGQKIKPEPKWKSPGVMQALNNISRMKPVLC